MELDQVMFEMDLATSNLNTIMLDRTKWLENYFKLFSGGMHRQIWDKYGISLHWNKNQSNILE